MITNIRGVGEGQAQAVRRGRGNKSDRNDLFHYMPADVQLSTAEVQHGLDFTDVLRDCLSCAVIIVDEHRKVTSFNPEAEDLTRLESDQLMGKGMDLLPDPIQEIVQETLSTGRSINARQLTLQDPERGDRLVQISTVPVRAGKGRISSVVTVLNDVSTIRKWELNMRRLDRLHNVGTLSASMAHEVRNAFVAVKTFVDLLLEQNKQADLADIVRLEMGRIDSILSQMRRISGPAKPAFSRVNLHLVLGKSLRLIQHLLEEKKIKVVRTFAASNDSLKGDQDQLEQAFINLFFNALDAMKPQGKLSVTTESIPQGSRIAGLPPGKDTSWLRVVIQDNGAGVAPENMERLFEPFFTTKPDGTGLGLAITRRIIQEHQGVIKVQSELNRGTTFNLLLPATDPLP